MANTITRNGVTYGVISQGSFESDRGTIAPRDKLLRLPDDGEVFYMTNDIDSPYGTGGKTGSYQIGTYKDGKLVVFDMFDKLKTMSDAVSKAQKDTGMFERDFNGFQQMYDGGEATVNINGQPVKFTMTKGTPGGAGGGATTMTYTATFPDGTTKSTSGITGLTHSNNYRFLNEVTAKAMGEEYEGLELGQNSGATSINMAGNANMKKLSERFANEEGFKISGNDLNTYHSGQLATYLGEPTKINDFNQITSAYDNYVASGAPEKFEFFKESEELTGDGASGYMDLVESGAGIRVPENLQEFQVDRGDKVTMVNSRGEEVSIFAENKAMYESMGYRDKAGIGTSDSSQWTNNPDSPNYIPPEDPGSAADAGVKFGDGTQQLPGVNMVSGMTENKDFNDQSGDNLTNKLPPGVLVRNIDDGRVYFIDGNSKFRYITKPELIDGKEVMDVHGSHFNFPKGDKRFWGPDITKPTENTNGEIVDIFLSKGSQDRLNATKIDWTKPRGFNPETGTTEESPTQDIIDQNRINAETDQTKYNDDLEKQEAADRAEEERLRKEREDRDAAHQKSVDDAKKRYNDDLAAQAKQKELEGKNIDPNDVSANYNYLIDDDNILIQFSDDPFPDNDFDDTNTYWLFDVSDRTYRPFADRAAVEALFGDNIDKAMAKMITVDTTALRNPAFAGKFYKRTYAFAIDDTGKLIKPEGGEFVTIPGAGPVTPGEPGTGPGGTDGGVDGGTDGGTDGGATGEAYAYGKNRLDWSLEDGALRTMGAILTPAKMKGDISEEILEETMGDPSGELVASYVKAVLYGGYSVIDIYADMKARQLSADGDTAYDNYKAFDTEMTATEWYQTEAGIALKSDPNLAPPPGVLNADVNMLDLPIWNLPGEVFATLVEPIDWNSPEFKAEAENIEAAWYDIMMQKAEAETEQGQAVAEQSWEIFRENLEKQYGLRLSDNAHVAWNQLQGIFEGSSQRGIGNTGLMYEAVDRYLADVRRQDQIMREEKITKESMEEINYLLKAGTPGQIAEFISANPDKAKMFSPSQENKDFFSLDNLKAIYPDMEDDKLQMISDMMMDENGNYRSGVYQNMYAGKYDLAEQKTSYQMNKLYEQKLLEEQRAYAPWSESNPFSSYMPDYITDALQQVQDNLDAITTNPGGDSSGPSGGSTIVTPPVIPALPDVSNLGIDWGAMLDVLNPNSYVGNLAGGSQTNTPSTPSFTEEKPGWNYNTTEGPDGQQIRIGNNNTGPAETNTGTSSNNNVNDAIKTSTGGDEAWNNYKSTYDKNLYQPISGAEFGTGSKQKANFYDIQPVGKSLYGIPYSSMTKVPGLGEMGKHDANDYFRVDSMDEDGPYGGGVYLKPGVNKMW